MFLSTTKVASTVCSFAIAISQSASSGTLTPALRTHLQSEPLQIVSAIRGLPLGVRDAMGELFGSRGLDIVDPGTEFQGTKPAAYSPLASRRLIAAGSATDNHCLIYYER